MTPLTSLDRNITHYSYFGSFRSFKSNVGINVAMLNSYGSLTDIGSWYLGGNATGAKPDNVTVTPTHTTPTATSTATYTVPPLVSTTTRSGVESLSNSAPSVLGVLMLSMSAMIL